jgi:hypothetical protein
MPEPAVQCRNLWKIFGEREQEALAAARGRLGRIDLGADSYGTGSNAKERGRYEGIVINAVQPDERVRAWRGRGELGVGFARDLVRLARRRRGELCEVAVALAAEVQDSLRGLCLHQNALADAGRFDGVADRDDLPSNSDQRRAAITSSALVTRATFCMA